MQFNLKIKYRTVNECITMNKKIQFNTTKNSFSRNNNNNN